MKRSEFDDMRADDARVKAAEEAEGGRQDAWLQLAAAIDMSNGKTAGDLEEDRADGLYEETHAADADITPEMLARSIGAPDSTIARDQGEETETEAPANGNATQS
jgi:hypothetical protein